MYQIVRLTPVYHFSTDAYLGTRVVERSHGYLSRALAHKLAARRWSADYEGCGDDSFYVVPFGGDPWRDRLIDPALLTSEEIAIPY